MQTMETRKFYIYILTNKINGTLYVGITGDLIERVTQHKEKIIKGFTKKYNLTRLVYYEEYENPKEAIYREKQLKKWKRQWKLELIEKENRDWKDLYLEFLELG
jgi:putative endonuclease